MVTGFQLVSIKGVEVFSVDEAKRTLLKAVENGTFGICEKCGEDISIKLRATIDELRLNRIAPLIVELPGRAGPTGGIDMSRIVGKSIGVKV